MFRIPGVPKSFICPRFRVSGGTKSVISLAFAPLELQNGHPCFTDGQCTSGRCELNTDRWSWSQRQQGDRGYCLPKDVATANDDQETGAHYANMLVLPGTKVTLCDIANDR